MPSPTTVSSQIDRGGAGAVRAYKRRPRKPISCDPCRHSKLRCDRQIPCNSCKRRGCLDSCLYKTPRVAGEQLSDPEPSLELSYPSAQPPKEPDGADGIRPAPAESSADATTAPIGAVSRSAAGLQERNDFTHARWEEVLQRPMNQNEQRAFAHNEGESRAVSFNFPFPLGPQVLTRDLLAMVPPVHCCDYLISQYFMHMSPFFHILHGPTFQREYSSFVRDPSAVDLSWLALLFMIISVALSTLEYDDAVLVDIWPSQSQLQDINAASRQFREAAMISLSKDQFLTRYRLNTLQALLLLIYKTGHDEGVEQGWTLLGMALNIGIALRCNAESEPEGVNCIEIERRRRCWAGLLTLYTYQAVSFPGIDMMFLTNITATMPTDVNDVDIREDSISQPSSQPTQMSVMMFKVRLFQLSSRICRHLKGPDKFDEATRDLLDAEIAEEQRQWDAAFLLDKVPSLLDFSSYAHWCFLQLHGHHLYLLVHQPFCRPRSNSSCFRQPSRAKCISSGAALLDLHRQIWEVPRLRPFRWTLYGMMSFYALHGAVALASCLLEEYKIEDSLQYREAFSAAVSRIKTLQDRSPICAKAYPLIHNLQTLLFPEQSKWPSQANSSFMDTLDTWVDNLQWLNSDTVDWNFLDAIVADGS